MNWFEKMVYGLKATMPLPTAYGWVHLLSIGLIVVLTILACVFLKNVSSKTFRIILLCCWIVIVILEVFKQLIFSFSYEDGVAKWDYQWYVFPFQLCSMQLYVLPFVIFLKDCKVRDAAMAFMSTFSLFGGLAVLIMPGDVFLSTIVINIQTMVHHGLQIILGIWLLVYNRKKLNFKYYLGGVICFLVLMAIALGLNLLAPTFTSETFNMFYVSPHFRCSLPVFYDIYPKVHFVVFLLLYVLPYLAVSAGIFYLAKLIKWLVDKRAKAGA